MALTRAGRTLAAAALATAAVTATSGAATAAEPPDQILVTADLDGDGVPDPVTVRQLSPSTQLLRVGLTDEFRDAVVVGDAGAPLPLVAPRPSDLDGDGRAELVLPVAVGANTTTFEVWRYDDAPGLHPVPTPDGTPWHLHEGGGVSAISGYGCTTAGAGAPRRLVRAVEARWDESRPGVEPIRYDGAVVTYDLTRGVARPVATQPVRDATRDDPRVRADPATCAPLP